MSIEDLEARLVLSTADLGVTVAAQHPQVGLGSPIEFTVTVTNYGPDTAPSVTLVDTLPPGFTPLVSLPTGATSSMSGNVLTINLPSMNVGLAASETVTISSFNQLTLGTTYTDLASVSGPGSTDPIPANDSSSASSTVITPSADLGVTLAPPATVATNGKINFTATVSDAGPTAAANATLTDTFTLPQGATITSATAGQGGTASISGNTVTATFGGIDTGASALLTVIVTSTVNGSFAESAGVISTTPDPASGNNNASLPSTPFQVASFSLVPSQTSATLHEPVTLTSTVSFLGGTSTPAGTVTFLEGSTVLGMVKVNSAGVATLPVSTLPLGTNTISATYAGDPNYPAITNPTTASVYVGDTQKVDFDGDGKADIALYGLIPGTNLYGFTIKTSSSGFTQTTIYDNAPYGFGNAYSVPVPADYFGDGKAAYAIWYPNNNGTMQFLAVSSVNPSKYNSTTFGLSTDVPVVGDVDGDGKADFGTYGPDPHNHNLYRYDFLLSSNNFNINQRLYYSNGTFGYGIPGSTPVVGDFDGSGRDGLGVYFPTPGTAAVGNFYYVSLAIPDTPSFVVNPAVTDFLSVHAGYSTDIPMTADVDGDGKADLVFYGPDPVTHKYRYDIVTSSTGFDTIKQVYFDNGGLGYGYAGSVPTIADYEGTGHADISLWQADGKGNSFYAFQDAALGYGVIYTFANMVELPAIAPPYVLAKRVPQ